jgi:hypothetical protein
VILLTVAGYAAARFGGMESGTAFGLLAGFAVAPFVPLPKPADP